MTGPPDEGTARRTLVLRVKRRRDDASSNSVGVVARLPQRRRLSDLRLSDQPLARQVLLARVATLESDQKDDVAVLGELVPSKRPLDSDSEGARSSMATSVLVFSERREIGGEGSVLVDMRRLPSRSLYVSSLERNRGRIVDPITRQLATAVNEAFRTDIPRDIRALLTSSFDVDFSSEATEGRTALMAAAHCGDSGLVDRLLALGADVCLSDCLGRGALEHAELRLSLRPHDRRATEEVLLRLHRELGRRASALRSTLEEESPQDFVYDVYRVPESLPEEESWAESLAVVPGLGLGEDSELVFEYDEQWSDLGDEDPDSNDERFEGNDYPEDEISTAGSADDDGYSDDSELEEALPKFERRGVGRVFIPFARDDPLLPASRRPGGVRALWGFDDDDLDERGVRLENMRERTGLRFGDNPRDFDDRGGARFGGELSDDDDDLRVLEDAMYGYQRPPPQGDTLAYDSELDRSDDD